MGGGRYELAWNGRKIEKSGNPLWWPPPRSPSRSWRVRRLAVKFGRQGRLAVILLPGRRVYKGGGRSRLPRQKPIGLKTGRNDPVRGSRSWGVFLGFLELKVSVLGLGFYLARKTRFI